MPAISPAYIFATLPNELYRTDDEYEGALVSALREEYRAIVDAGFVLQIDDPGLVTYYMMNADVSVADCRKRAARGWRRSTNRSAASRASACAFTPVTASTSVRASTTWN